MFSDDQKREKNKVTDPQRELELKSDELINPVETESKHIPVPKKRVLESVL